MKNKKPTPPHKKKSRLSSVGRTLIKGILKKTKKPKVTKKASKRKMVVSLTAASVSSVGQEISSAKFYTGVYVPEEVTTSYSELPEGYREDRIVVQVRDPWWIHAYWEVRPSTIEEIKSRLGERFHGARGILRVYDVSYITFSGTNAHRYFDIEINFEARNWYIDVGGPGRSWCVDIGFILDDGSFFMIVRSNTVTTPLDGPSWITDEEWMIPDDLFARLYGMGFGIGPSSPPVKGWQERLRIPIGSPGLFSISSPARVQVKEEKRDFWLVVNTELIVYGATKPDAKVTVCGRPIKLNRDGSFSLRFALPDGKQVIPVEARPPDDTDCRSITPVVSKKTQ